MLAFNDAQDAITVFLTFANFHETTHWKTELVSTIAQRAHGVSDLVARYDASPIVRDVDDIFAPLSHIYVVYSGSYPGIYIDQESARMSMRDCTLGVRGGFAISGGPGAFRAALKAITSNGQVFGHFNCHRAVKWVHDVPFNCIGKPLPRSGTDKTFRPARLDLLCVERPTFDAIKNPVYGDELRALLLPYLSKAKKRSTQSSTPAPSPQKKKGKQRAIQPVISAPPSPTISLSDDMFDETDDIFSDYTHDIPVPFLKTPFPASPTSTSSQTLKPSQAFDSPVAPSQAVNDPVASSQVPEVALSQALGPEGSAGPVTPSQALAPAGLSSPGPSRTRLLSPGPSRARLLSPGPSRNSPLSPSALSRTPSAAPSPLLTGAPDLVLAYAAAHYNGNDSIAVTRALQRAVAYDTLDEMLDNVEMPECLTASKLELGVRIYIAACKVRNSEQSDVA
ncbi:hypothetical protein CYLTODRAFT_495540 [Cylindrobasidium torrendii FP15055 ss-10]|uniref:Uncharacterized protein n=1 Tax=Cylindrobasidium torrendii FP15055 ss-10 TaxID=1314674 RepID=A0A0D7ATW9_9AGAR|nr:hypothetical protein CYLTODRAFT_495540 [Cylindrobasidium torrendii FP15055 ss-10]